MKVKSYEEILTDINSWMWENSLVVSIVNINIKCEQSLTDLQLYFDFNESGKQRTEKLI